MLLLQAELTMSWPESLDRYYDDDFLKINFDRITFNHTIKELIFLSVLCIVV